MQSALGALDSLRSLISAIAHESAQRGGIPRRGAIRYHAVVRYRPERSTGEAGYSQVLRIMIGRRLELGVS